MSYDTLIQTYLEKPVHAVTASHAVDQMFEEYTPKASDGIPFSFLGFNVPLSVVVASVFEPHRTNPDTHKMLQFMKISDAREYFWSELRHRKLMIGGIDRCKTWDTSLVRFLPETSFNSLVKTGHPEHDLHELMAEGLKILSSIATLENAKAVGQL